MMLTTISIPVGGGAAEGNDYGAVRDGRGGVRHGRRNTAERNGNNLDHHTYTIKSNSPFVCAVVWVRVCLAHIEPR